VAGLGWYLWCRLQHSWSVHVECGGEGFMAVLKNLSGSET